MSAEDKETIVLELTHTEAQAVERAAAELGFTTEDFIALAVKEMMNRLEMEVAR